MGSASRDVAGLASFRSARLASFCRCCPSVESARRCAGKGIGCAGCRPESGSRSSLMKGSSGNRVGFVRVRIAAAHRTVRAPSRVVEPARVVPRRSPGGVVRVRDRCARVRRPIGPRSLPGDRLRFAHATRCVADRSIVGPAPPRFATPRCIASEAARRGRSLPIRSSNQPTVPVATIGPRPLESPRCFGPRRPASNIIEIRGGSSHAPVGGPTGVGRSLRRQDQPTSRSIGLRTPRPPRFSTWV